jgi:hypothetical protein
MKRIKYILISLGLITSIGAAAIPSNVGAFDIWGSACSGDAKNTALCKEDKSAEYYITAIVNTLLYVLGAVSVIVIIIAGIYYTTSGGDPALVKRAKDSLLYAVIGLIVAVMAYAIVNFVVGRF